jgi:hypothetical protein
MALMLLQICSAQTSLQFYLTFRIFRDCRILCEVLPSFFISQNTGNAVEAAASEEVRTHITSLHSNNVYRMIIPVTCFQLTSQGTGIELALLLTIYR